MARPKPCSGMGMTAMRRMPGRSSARSMANRLAAASDRSPCGLRLSAGRSAAHEGVGAEGQQRLVGGGARGVRAGPAAPGA